jgi:hypothetical protein
MYSTSQQPQLSQQPAQMSVQHWQNNNGQLIEQTSQMSAT